MARALAHRRTAEHGGSTPGSAVHTQLVKIEQDRNADVIEAPVAIVVRVGQDPTRHVS